MDNRQPSPWQRFRSKVRDEGPLHAALVALNSLVPRSLLDIRVWVVASTELSGFADAEFPDVGVCWAVVTKDGGFDALDEATVSIEDSLARGELASVIERDGRVVGFETFAAGVFVKEDWLRFALRDDEVYGIRIFVVPEYRGQDLAVWIASFAYREFARMGYRRDYGVTDVLNRRSLRAHAKARHWPVGRIAYGRCCGFTVIRIGRRVRAGFWSADNPLVIDFSTFDDS